MGALSGMDGAQPIMANDHIADASRMVERFMPVTRLP
jgi:hypothetical protein